MFSSKNINLNGLVLKGDEPTSPRTGLFLKQFGVQVKKENGKVNISGNFSLPTDEVESFLKDKDAYLKNK